MSNPKDLGTIWIDGDRGDIALERDRAYNNRPPEPYTRWEDYRAAESMRDHNDDWGDEEAPTLKSLIDSLIDNGKGGGTFACRDYQYEEIEKVRYEILIERGWDCDEFQIDLRQNQPYQFEIYMTEKNGLDY